MDLICGQPTMSGWITTVPASDVHVSAVTLAHLQAEIAEIPVEDGRLELDQALRSFTAYARRANAIEVFDEEAARAYATLAFGPFLLDDGTPLGDMSLMVVATAIDRNLELVEERQPYHSEIGNLRIVDPSA